MTLNDFTNIYLDWVNNFLTVERFAEYYEIPIEQAQKIIDLGRQVSEIDLNKKVIY